MSTTERWVWFKMPEKSYYGHVAIYHRKGCDPLCIVTMVDPIPNKLADECYGSTFRARSIAEAARTFEKDMLADRKKYVGKDWTPSNAHLRLLWKSRERFRESALESIGHDRKDYGGSAAGGRTAPHRCSRSTCSESQRRRRRCSSSR